MCLIFILTDFQILKNPLYYIETKKETHESYMVDVIY